MDLGNILNTGLDIYSKYQTIKNAGQSVTQVPVYNSPLIPDQLEQFMPYFDEATGQTVMVSQPKKRCRRRRRRLATKSDLGDLAALKAILGNGEAFKAWIATHSR